MSQSTNSSRISPTPRRRMGCFPKILIVALVLGVVYWLLFVPINSNAPSGGGNSQPILIDGELSPQQQAGYDTLASQSGEPPRIVAKEGIVRFLSSNVPIPDDVAVNPSEKALYFLEQHKDLFQIENVRKNLRLQEKTKDDAGNVYVTYTQEYQGIPVYGSSVTVGISANGEVTLVNGGYQPNLVMDVKPVIRSRDAENTAVADFNAQDGKVTSFAKLAIYSQSVGGNDAASDPKLVWVLTVGSKTNPYVGQRIYLVDAKVGNVVEKIETALEFDGALEVFIFDVEGASASTHADFLAISETTAYDYRSENLSPSVVSTYENMNRINNYFWNTFERNSYTGDEKGKIVTIIVDVVQYGQDGKQCRAGWYPNSELIILCRGWSLALDPLAHEYGHAVNSYSAKLPSNIGEGGALNEAFGDLFAVFIDDVDPWHIRGDNSERRDLTVSVHFQDPEKSCGNDDLGCVHANSVVFSHAAYLMDQNGVPREKLQYIYYYALQNIIKSATDFKTAANDIVNACDKLEKDKLYKSQPDITPEDCQIVEQALISVGLIKGSSSQPPSVDLDLDLGFLDNIKYFFMGLQQEIRDYIDKLIGDLRQKIEDEINRIAENIRRKIEEMFRDLMRELLSMIIDALNQFFLQLCGIPCMSAFIPLGAVIFGSHYRRKM